MALLRYEISGAVPLPLTPTEKAFIDDLIPRLRRLKNYCKKINEGLPNEEATTSFTYHICHHDEPNNTISCSDTLQEI